MTKKYDETNRGVLFKSKDKKSDKHPDRKGQINIDGVEYWLSAWDKDKGVISISVQKKERQKESSPQDDSEVDHIPF